MIRRRAEAQLGAFFIVALCAVSACGSAPDRAGHDTADRPRAGGTLTFATDVDPACLDPQQSPLAAALLSGRGVVDSLVAQDPRTGAVTPWLARSWQVSPDARQFTFTLRDGVTFSDGARVDADAVKRNLDRIVDPATKSLLAAAFLTGYTGSTVVDPHTVTVTFARPNASFLQAASTAFLGLQSPASFAAGPQRTCQQVVGSGPFVVSKYVPQQRIELARRQGYAWAPAFAAHHGEAYLDHLTIRFVPENGVRVGSQRSGQVDAAGNVPPRDAVELRDAGFPLLRKEQPGIAYSLFLNSSRAPWTDPNLRAAVAKAVDPAQLVKTLYQDQYGLAHSVLTPTTPGYADVRPTGGADPAQAGRLLDAAGWRMGPDGFRHRDGVPLQLHWTYISPAREQRDVAAQLVQQQLKAVGIDLRLTPAAPGDVIAHQVKGDWELSDLSFLRADGDVLRTVLQSGGPGRPAVVSDAEFAAALTQGESSTDPAARSTSYQAAQRRLISQNYAIPIYNPTYLLTTGKRVHGVAFDAMGLPAFYDAWLAG